MNAPQQTAGAAPLSLALGSAALGLGGGLIPIPAGEKGPVMPDWPNHGTTEPRTIESWLAHGQNYGVVCGNGLVVIDVDVKNGAKGAASLEDLQVLNGDLPRTRKVQTPSGGWHLYFKLPPGADVGCPKKALPEGIDVRGSGGQVVGPGSRTQIGAYELVDDAPVADMPAWLVAKLKWQTASKIDRKMTEPPPEQAGGPGKVLEAVEYVLDEPETTEGNRDNEAYLLANRLKDRFTLTSHDCLSAMRLWNRERCQPPLEEDVVEDKVRSAYKNGRNDPGSADPEHQFSPIEPAGRLRFLRPSEITLPKTNPYLVKGLLDEGSTAVLYGQSNTGKTFLAMDLAGHIAAGRPWGGRKVRKGLVVYVATEASRSAQLRLEALKRRLGSQDFPLALVPYTVDLRSSKADASELVALVHKAEEAFGEKCVLVVVDTLARAFAGGNENASEDMGKFVANVSYLREKCECATLIVHHKGKNEAAGARGHSSLRAAVETELEVSVDDKTQARIVSATKQRDMEAGRPFGFMLRRLVLGVDDEGEEITSCTVALDNDVEYDFAPITGPTRLPAVQQAVYSAVGAAIADPRAFEREGRRWANPKLIALYFSGRAADYVGMSRKSLPAVTKLGQGKDQLYWALRSLSVESGPLMKNDNNQYTTVDLWGEPHSVES